MPVSNDVDSEYLSLGLEPLRPYQGNSKPRRYRCTTCGFLGRVSLLRLREGKTCPQCAGGRAARPAYLYLMHDARRQVFKYGMGLVTGTGRRPRLAQHLRRGFVLCHRIDLPTGALAYAAEGALKAHLRIVGIGPALTAEQMPDGWTEPVADDALSQGQLVELLAAFAEAAT